jgi:hypothetical protein
MSYVNKWRLTLEVPSETLSVVEKADPPGPYYSLASYYLPKRTGTYSVQQSLGVLTLPLVIGRRSLLESIGDLSVSSPL